LAGDVDYNQKFDFSKNDKATTILRGILFDRVSNDFGGSGNLNDIKMSIDPYGENGVGMSFDVKDGDHGEREITGDEANKAVMNYVIGQELESILGPYVNSGISNNPELLQFLNDKGYTNDSLYSII
jgi:hypothetical protein